MSGRSLPLPPWGGNKARSFSPRRLIRNKQSRTRRRRFGERTKIGVRTWLLLCRLLLGFGLGFRFHLFQFVIQLLHRRFERGDFGAGGGEIAIGGGALLLSVVGQFVQRLLKELDIGLQACGPPLHLLFGGADFHAANVLCGRGRQRHHEHQSRSAQKLRHFVPRPPKLLLFAFHAAEAVAIAGSIRRSCRRVGPPATIWTTPAANPISVPICQASS